MKNTLFAFAATMVLFATVFLHAQENATTTNLENSQIEDVQASPLPPPPTPELKPFAPLHSPGIGPGAGRFPSPEMRKFFQELKKNDPKEYKRLMKLRLENREEFLREVSCKIPRPQRETERKLEELDRKCWRLSKEIRETTDEKRKEELTEELREASTETLDLLVKQTEQHIEEMNKRLQFFKEKREDILKKKLQFFLNTPHNAH